MALRMRQRVHAQAAVRYGSMMTAHHHWMILIGAQNHFLRVNQR